MRTTDARDACGTWPFATYLDVVRCSKGIPLKAQPLGLLLCIYRPPAKPRANNNWPKFMICRLCGTT